MLLNYLFVIAMIALMGCSSVLSSGDYTDYTIEDVFIPAQCDSIAKPADHLLLEYTIVFENGTIASYLKRPSQLYHVLLDKSVRNLEVVT